MKKLGYVFISRLYEITSFIFHKRYLYSQQIKNNNLEVLSHNFNQYINHSQSQVKIFCNLVSCISSSHQKLTVIL
jgi:hypothetical protein